MNQQTALDPLDGCYRENVKMWSKVAVVLKKDQKTGSLTEGHVRGILTSKPFHSRGIKVLLHNRQVGRVQQIIDPNPLPYDQRF
jgi:uncharacterized repeat protein (TIGR03833 family)